MAYSNFYAFKGSYANSISYVDSALTIINKQDLKDSLWTDYYFAANIHKAVTLYKLGHYSRAIDVYFKLKEFADKSDKKGAIAYKLDNNIGLVLFKQKKFEKAKWYFELALADMKYDINDTYNIVFRQQFLDNIGLCFANMGNTDSALIFYRIALLVTITDSDKFNHDVLQNKVFKLISRGVIMNGMAQAFSKEGKLDSAEILLKKNIAVNTQLPNHQNRYAQLSELYMVQLYGLKQQYPEMREHLGYLRKSLDAAKEDEVELGWRESMAAYSKKNYPITEALKLENSYLKFKDSLNAVNEASAAGDINSELKPYIDGDIGVAYTDSHWLISGTMPDLSATLLKTSDSRFDADQLLFVGAAAYKFNIASDYNNITLEPLAAYRIVKGYKDIIDAGMNLTFNNYGLNLQMLYHTNQNTSLGVGLNLKTVTLIFNYNIETGALSNYTNGSFELGMKFHVL